MAGDKSKIGSSKRLINHLVRLATVRLTEIRKTNQGELRKFRIFFPALEEEASVDNTCDAAHIWAQWDIADKKDLKRETECHLTTLSVGTGRCRSKGEIG
jgi:hypothetical protein